MDFIQWVNDRLYSWLLGCNGDDSSLGSIETIESESTIETAEINPATGLTMIGGGGGIDTGGNPYGTDFHDDDILSSSDIHDDSWCDSSDSIFENSFSDDGFSDSIWDD